MMHITIAECTDDGTVVPICDQFVENKYVTIADLKADKRHLRHERIITTEIKGVRSFTSKPFRDSDIDSLPETQKTSNMNGLKNKYNEENEKGTD